MSFIRSVNVIQEDWEKLGAILNGGNKSLLIQLLVKAVITGQIKADLSGDVKQIILLDQVAIDLDGVIYNIEYDSVEEEKEEEATTFPEPITSQEDLSLTTIPSPAPALGQLSVAFTVPTPAPVPMPAPVITPEAIPINNSSLVIAPVPTETPDLTNLLEEEQATISMSPSILAVYNIRKLLEVLPDCDPSLLALAEQELLRLQKDPESDFDSGLETGLQIAMQKSSKCGLL